MKALFKICFAAVFALASLTMVTSCNPFGLGGGGSYEYEDYEYGWTEEGNKLIFKYDAGLDWGGYALVLIFEFKNDICIKATAEYIWSSAAYARMFYDELDEDTKKNAKLKGSKVTVDMTDEYKDLKKSDLKAAIDMDNGWM